MTAREAILKDIRRNLGRDDIATPPANIPFVRLQVPEVPLEARIESMLARVVALAGKAVRARDVAEARDYVACVTASGQSVASNAPYLRECGIASLPGIRTGISEETHLRTLCATADYGITSAQFALSDTGSLVMMAGAAEARLISLLPPVHIAVIPAACLLTGLDEFYTLVPRPADLTSSTVFITGPSRTADIELILVRGVHGPREVHVVIVG